MTEKTAKYLASQYRLCNEHAKNALQGSFRYVARAEAALLMLHAAGYKLDEQDMLLQKVDGQWISVE